MTVKISFDGESRLRLTVFRVFHNHVDALIVLKVVNEPDNVGVLQFALDFNFPLNVVDAGEGKQIGFRDNFHGVFVSGGLLLGQLDLPVAALSDALAPDLEVLQFSPDGFQSDVRGLGFRFGVVAHRFVLIWVCFLVLVVVSVHLGRCCAI